MEMAGKKKASRSKSGLGRTLQRKQRRRRKEVSNLLGRFGRYLVKRREATGMSIRQFADHAGMPFSNIFQMEDLRKNPRLTELEQLAQAFGETLAQFLEPLLQPFEDERIEQAVEPPLVAVQ